MNAWATMEALMRTPGVILWVAVLVPFGARISLAHVTRVGGRSPWDTSPTQGERSSLRFLVPPVRPVAWMLVAELVASALMTLLAPWINRLPAARELATAVLAGSVVASLTWLYLELRASDRRRREMARDYRTPGWDSQ